ncbi:hypothetical protein T06_11627 [Trichinella sp. T6]|nr:hypothetical protein T06_11627 [Trichinella sp. T6]
MRSMNTVSLSSRNAQERSALSSVHFLQATSEVVRSWCSHWDRSFLIGFVMDIDHAIVWLFDFLAVPYIRGHVSAWPWLAIGQRTRCFLVMVAQCSYFTIPHFVGLLGRACFYS